MGKIDELKEWYENLDPMERQKVIVFAFFVLLIFYAMIRIASTLTTVGDSLGSGAELMVGDSSDALKLLE